MIKHDPERVELFALELEREWPEVSAMLTSYAEVLREAVTEEPRSPASYSRENPPRKGDRVRVVRVTGVKNVEVGQVGTVQEDHPSPWIRFDEPTGYPYAVSYLGIPAGYAECLEFDKIERVA